MKSLDAGATDSADESAGTRRYRMVARAETAARTHRQILEAALALYTERDFDQVSLEDVAARAGVAVRTVLRRFGSKEALVDAVAQAGDQAVEDRRQDVASGDAAAAVGCVVGDYERYGDAIMRLLAQEERVPAFRPIAERGRRLHHEWVERTFAPQMARRRGAARRRLLIELIAITDVYNWKLLRRDMRLDEAATAEVLGEMVAAVTNHEATRGSG
jgi:AcrR family transcriptional regulator